MTIEEKAKAYDSMFERCKEMYNNNKTNTVARLIYERYFPELKEESEGERIRKALIYHYQGDGCLCNNEYRIDYKDIRTWLEKQGKSCLQHGSMVDRTRLHKNRKGMSKICSDIEQSKKLKELGLSPESADMYYQYVLPRSEKIKFNPEIGSPIESLKWYNSGYTFSNRREPLSLEEFCIPAWSLSALLRVLKDYTLQTTTDGKVFIVSELEDKPYTLNSEECENEVDACVDMIIKLHEYDVL